MNLGDALLIIFAATVGLVVLVAVLLGIFWLLAHATRLALTILLSLFGMVVVIVIYMDALNGSPLARRAAWVILWLAKNLYTGIDQSTSGVPELPNWFE